MSQPSHPTPNLSPDPLQAEMAALLAEQSEHWLNGNKVQVETYLARLPILRADAERALDLVYNEVVLREELGEKPRLDEYLARFPQWAADLERQFELHQALETAASGPTTVSPVAGPLKCVLEIVKGPHQGTRLEFSQQEKLLVGRGSTAQLRLTQDAHFSRHHFLLELDPPRCQLRDLGSRNGTYVNGCKVNECTLRHGDVISGGKTHIRFFLQPVGEQETIRTPPPPGTLP
jgi:hypothetical protein